ncbi:MAG TPA: glycosyltransferase family 2 protein [Candidatus Saccharimonadales bacterium]|nr:glycosyltransferase family 2 protein [Candidatus Saccharimonadales bacterium]
MTYLSIIIPSYNSNDRVVKLIGLIKKLKIPGINKEIIVVDDASRNHTFSQLKKLKGIILIRHSKNTGKGGAIQTGLKRAKGDILFLQDDDMEYDPFDIPKVIKPILKGKTEIVFGSRRLNKKNSYSSFIYYAGGVFVDFIISLILQTGTTDAITGSKAFTRNVYDSIKPIESAGFEIESEIVAKAVKAGFMPAEVPISYNPRSHQEGKNIRWHHVYPIFKTLLKYAWFS